MNIYEKIRELRLEKGLSQADMSDSLNIGQSSYFQIEKGKTELTITRLYQIADALKVSVGELLEEPLRTEKPNEEIELLRKRIMELEKRNKELEDMVAVMMPASKMFVEIMPKVLKYFEEKADKIAKKSDKKLKESNE